MWTELQTAIKEGAAPEVVERLQAQFDLLTQRIKDAESAATGMGKAMGDAANQTMTLEGAFKQFACRRVGVDLRFRRDWLDSGSRQWPDDPRIGLFLLTQCLHEKPGTLAGLSDPSELSC